MKTQSNASAIEILLIDDNPSDVRLTLELFNEIKLKNNIHIASSDSDAIAYLKREGAYADALQPDIIFMEMGLPRESGFELLRMISQCQLWRNIPVVALLSSPNESEILHQAGVRVGHALVKPINIPSLVEVLNHMDNFWLSIVQQNQ